VNVSLGDAPHFLGRKDWSTQNIFLTCDFNMKFTYVMTGWKETTLGSRILKETFIREDLLVILEGQFKVFRST